MSIQQTLDSKNFKLFSRNKEKLTTELINFVLLMGILTLFGLILKSNGLTTIDAGPAPASHEIMANTSLSLCSMYGYYTSKTPCYVYFGNTDAGDGCTNPLSALMATMPLCTKATDIAEMSSLYITDGIVYPICKCEPPSSFSNDSWSGSNNAAVAIQFDENNVANGAYTIFGPDIGLTENSFKNNVNKYVNISDEASDMYSTYSKIVPWQVSVDSAIIGKNVSINVQFFPQNAFTQIDLSQVTMLPLYVALLTAYSLVAITVEICKESKFGLRHGLSMIGLEPFTYWLSWMRIMAMRMSVTLIGIALVCKLLIIVQVDMIFLMITLLLYSLWMMMLSIFIGLVGVDPDTCTMFLVAATSLVASLSYVYLPYFYGSSYVVPIPDWGTTLLAYAFPPFAMSMIIVIGMYFTSIGQPLNFSSSNSTTPFFVTCSGMIFAIAIGIMIMACVNWYLIVKSRGLASTSNSSPVTHGGMSAEDSLKGTEQNVRIAVSIKKLKKEFVRNDGSINKAVDGLTVDFYENQITSFLGHNGAGKSTTISLLTGLFNPDSGDAFIRGFSVANEMTQIRPLMGVCPQTNILWDLLTVRDHMQLFARIRNISDVASRDEIHELMKDIGLVDKADTYAKDLSGGQKRKLCTAIALIGNPSIVFLDEPTAGMDSSARRDVWNMLLKRKAGKCIILCTHQMDEADVLGDRIAVVSAGQLQEIGTPAFLKAKWGKGVRVDMAIQASTDRRALLHDLTQAAGRNVALDLSEVLDNEEEQNIATQDKLNDKSQGDMHVVVPNDANIALVLDLLENKKKHNGGVEDFGITATNLEDVFWELGKKAELERGDVHQTSLPDELKLTPPSWDVKVKSMLHRLAIVFFRDLGKQIRNYSWFFLYLGTAIFMYSFNFSFTSENVGTVNLTSTSFDNVQAPLAVAWDGEAVPIPGMVQAMQIFAASNSALPTPFNATAVSPCLDAWLLESTDSAICSYSRASPPSSASSPNQMQPAGHPGFVGAYEFDFQTAAAYRYTILTNQSISLGLVGLVSFANNAIWAESSGVISPRLQTSFYQWIKPVSPESSYVATLIVTTITSSIGGLLFSVAMCILGAKLALSIVSDKKMSIKQLQTLMGVTKLEYLICYSVWDIIQSLVLLSIPVVVCFALDNSVADGTLILALFMFFMAYIPLIHMIAGIFDEPDTAYTVTYNLLLASFIGLFLVNTIYGSVTLFSDDSDTTAADTVRYLVMLHPLVALQQAMQGIAYAKALEYHPLLMTAPQLPYELNPPTAAWPVIYLFLESVAFFSLYVVMEYYPIESLNKCMFVVKQYLCRCVCIEKFYISKNVFEPVAEHEDDDGGFIDLSTVAVTDIEDDDVQLERTECSAQRPSALQMVNLNVSDDNVPIRPAVLVSSVRIQYPPAGKQRYEGTTAVHDFSLRIKNKECFSLLGSNGAGKTSVMNALLKQINCTSGSIYVHGEEISSMSDKVAQTMSYCPQHNALFETLTVVECLEFYCKLRGVSEAQLSKYSTQWIEAADLKEHRHTWCTNLSGGNKRKLSLAIALIGNPSFIVLDEPSAGVDPAARRKLHWLINATKRRGATIVLTTHHMDEAAMLGDRVGIMIKGYLTCLGTVQHLLNKYSHGYLLTVFMSAGFTVSDCLLPVVQEICPTCKVGTASGVQFCSIVLGNSNSFSIADLYRALQSLQNEKKVEYFTCGQSRLEDVFLLLTEKLLRTNATENTTTNPRIPDMPPL